MRKFGAAFLSVMMLFNANMPTAIIAEGTPPESTPETAEEISEATEEIQTEEGSGSDEGEVIPETETEKRLFEEAKAKREAMKQNRK